MFGARDTGQNQGSVSARSEERRERWSAGAAIEPGSAVQRGEASAWRARSALSWTLLLGAAALLLLVLLALLGSQLSSEQAPRLARSPSAAGRDATIALPRRLPGDGQPAAMGGARGAARTRAASKATHRSSLKAPVLALRPVNHARSRRTAAHQHRVHRTRTPHTHASAPISPLTGGAIAPSSKVAPASHAGGVRAQQPRTRQARRGVRNNAARVKHRRRHRRRQRRRHLRR